LKAREKIKVGQVRFAPPHVAYVSRRERLGVEPSLGTTQNFAKQDKVLRVSSLDELQKHFAQELGSKGEGIFHLVVVVAAAAAAAAAAVYVGWWWKKGKGRCPNGRAAG